MPAHQIKKRKVVIHSSLWNEDILYEIVSFIMYVKDIIHFAQSCRDIYNCLLENEICLNSIFEYYTFKKLPKEFPNYFKNIKHLHFLEGDLTIEQLQKFTKIESLTLPDEFEITDLFLENCKNLKLLNISYNSNKNNKYLNFEVLKDNLEDLNIGKTNITDEQIENLQNLTNLNVRTCKNITGDCFINFTKLKKLKAKYINLNTEFLNDLFNLEYLNLSYSSLYNDGFSISKLEKFKQLKILKLKEITIYNSQYFELLNLIELNLDDADINDILKLKLPNSLQTLSLVNIIDITDKQLSNLNNLTYLNITNCYQLQCSFLENMKNLKKLVAEKTLISDKELSFCKKLQYLNINKCLNVNGTSLLNLENLVSLKGSHLIKEEHLNNLKKLKFLSLRDNLNITGESFLNLFNLEHFYCNNCFKIKGTNFNYLEKLKRLELLNMFVKDEDLQDLNNLKELNIAICPNFTGNCLQYLKNLKKFSYSSLGANLKVSKDKLKDVIETLKSKSITEFKNSSSFNII